MKRILPLLFLLLPLGLRAQDTLDVIHYDLTLDIGHLQSRTLVGEARLTVALTQATSTVRLDLLNATVDSALVEGQPVEHTYSGQRHLFLPIGQRQAGDTLEITVFYRSSGTVESYGFGGLHLDNGLFYNLGVAFADYPHNYGRSMFPCHDNFTDKATYSLHLTSPIGWTTTASGILQSATLNEDQSETSHWELSLPTPTYLISVSMGPFRYIRKETAGYPTIIAFRGEDSARVAQAFAQLDQVVPMYERCFGPYRWGTIGYTGTPRGSMEHANNISLSDFALTDLSQTGQGVMAHELAHAWFGNLVTCASAEDMWINEGGASFCEEVAAEAARGPRHAREVYEENLYNVLSSTHITDHGYLPLYGIDSTLTYGSTVYNKGALVWHSLRGTLGDSLFYACLTRLFDRCAFSNLTSLQLRDSLSAYSGRDLTDFFDFHVFQPGFADINVDFMGTTHYVMGDYEGWDVGIKVRQQLVGNDSLAFARLGRVPVSFFQGRRLLMDTVITVDDSVQWHSFILDECPDRVLIDRQRRLSDAVTEGDTLVATRCSFDMPRAQFKMSLTSTPADTAYLHAALHWAPACRHPGNNGIIRLANRYWVLTGAVPEGFSGRPGFAYDRNAGAHLDRELLPTVESLDSLRLLYRPDADHPWQVLNSSRTSSNTSGYISAGAYRPGQYTLAVVDDSLASVNTPNPSPLRVFPNPTSGPVTIEAPSANLPLQLHIYDLQGRLVKEQLITHHSSLITLDGLPHGTYTLRVFGLSNRTLGTQTIIINNF